MSKRKATLGETLDDVLESLDKTYGEGTVMSFNQAPLEMERVSTGSLILDIALGGGYPKGKIIELFGDEGTGKSTLALHFLAQFDKDDTIMYIDTEQALDREYAERLGICTDSMKFSQPDYTEQALEITRRVCQKVDGLVYDSVAEGSTYREMESEIGDRKIGDKAFVFGQAMRVLKALKNKGTLLFINQIRIDPNITYGSNRVTPAGKALKFATHVRVEINRGQWIKKGSGDTAEKVGHYMRCRIVKNKSGRPHITVNIPIIYDGFGVSRTQEIIDLGLDAGIIVKKGSWFAHDGANIAQGEARTRSFIEDNPEYATQLENEIRQYYESVSSESDTKQ